MADRTKALNALLRKIGPTRLLNYAYQQTLRDMRSERRRAISVSLALQGGGALGAFTWGVLDRFAGDSGIRVEAMSGASAGAVNAALYASGFVTGGSRGARQALRYFWTEISSATALANFFLAPFVMGGAPSLAWSRGGEPTRYGIAPPVLNPLRDMLRRHVDIDALRAPEAPRLYVSATNVISAQAEVFSNGDITHDVLVASACIPGVHPTVWIGETPYWDGGLTANPAMTPLLDHPADRLVLVRLTRSGAPKPPRTPSDIDAYLKTLMFSKPLEVALPAFCRRAKSNRIGIDEIDATAVVEEGMMSQPSPHFVRSLSSRGATSAESYLEGLKTPGGRQKSETSDVARSVS